MDCTVKNANYDRVVVIIKKYLAEESRNVCACPRCANDIAAIALNFLPPHYYVELEAEKKEIGSPWVMVETAVVEAIERVSANPNHPHLRQHEAPPSQPDSRALMS